MKKLIYVVFMVALFLVLVVPQVRAETCTAYSNWPTEQPPAAGTLGAPTGITATPGDASFTLSWNAVTGATGYKITITDGSKFGTKTVTGTSTTISGTVGNLTIANGTSYQVKIQTQNKSDLDEDQYGAYSSIVCATPTAGGGTTTTTTSTSTTTTTSSTTTTTVSSTTTTTTTTTLPPLPDCTQLKNYVSKMDVNGDGEINALDAALIIRYLNQGCK